MGIAKKTDGRYVVGLGVTDANDYKGSASYRDIYIQLTADGATEESVEYLTYLKDYAVYANAQGEPIMPPSVNVWISNNGKTTAVEADDLSLDGDNYTICGIVWDGSSWDYSNAGQGHGGGGLPEVTSADEGKVLAVNASGEWAAENQFYYVDMSDYTLNKTWQEIFNAAKSGKTVILGSPTETFISRDVLVFIRIEEGSYQVGFVMEGTPFVTNSADGYPVYDD